MISFDQDNRVLKDIFLSRMQNLNKGVELDIHVVEFDDVRYHIQASANEPNLIRLSLALPQASPEVVTTRGLPLGAVDSVHSAYGAVAQVVNSPEKGFHITLHVDLSRVPLSEGREAMLAKLAAVRAVVMCAPLREILKPLARGCMSENADSLTALMHRPNEAYFAIIQAEKVTLVFPMRFQDLNDVVLATAFLQEFMEARRAPGLSAAPPCTYSGTPPLELKGVPAQALDANAGFVSFVIFPHHVTGTRLDKTTWILSTFYAYVNYHIKCSKAFMHTRMRRRVETLIQVLNRAKPDPEKGQAGKAK